MRIRLNGWQRLWVVLTALFLVPILLFINEQWSTGADYANSRVRASMELVGHYLESTTPGFTFEGSDVVRQKYYGNLTDEQIINELHSKYGDKVDFSMVEAEYHRETNGLWIAHAKLIGFALLLWLLSSLSLYLLGTSVAWVIRSFRGKRSQER